MSDYERAVGHAAKVFAALAADDRRELAQVNEAYQQHVDAIICERDTACAQLEQARNIIRALVNSTDSDLSPTGHRLADVRASAIDYLEDLD